MSNYLESAVHGPRLPAKITHTGRDPTRVADCFICLFCVTQRPLTRRKKKGQPLALFSI